MPLLPSDPTTAGVSLTDRGAVFVLASEVAEAVELCLFPEPEDSGGERRLAARRAANGLWICHVADARAGQSYGYRVHGPYDPAAGLRCNPSKLLLDPYARAVTGELIWNDAVFGYPKDRGDGPTACGLDSAPHVPRAVVVDGAFDWGDDAAPRRAWSDTVLYECHVKGMTQRHPDVPSELRGTYLGLSHPAVIEHLTLLGVTSVELLPVHHSVSQRALIERGLVNYWGYDPIAFFAPDRRFATPDGDPVVEFKSMVRALHRAGLEVILDVVFNHTGETDRLGPTLSMRGIDNRMYYRLAPGDFASYENHSGCGNSLNTDHPLVQKLVLDCLRYWVVEMRVDGFRFDLAASLGRTTEGFEPDHPMLRAIEEDPALANVKLIAEPWDVGPFGHLTGRFGPAWSEWNDRFRDDVRRYWRGDAGRTPGMATRLAGSSDLFAHKRERAASSVNFVTSHDGFTLVDLVSYERKHNEANGEDNRDGANDNHSRNWGFEGDTADAAILSRRDRMRRAMFATLAFSRGTPMISHGDESGRSQGGNNNAYCQDNHVSWMRWELSPEDRRFLDFAAQCLALRRAHTSLRGAAFLDGERACGCGLKDVTWLTAEGDQMAPGDWHDPERRLLCVMLHSHGPAATLSAHAPAAARPDDSTDTVLIVANAGAREAAVRLPAPPFRAYWTRELDSGVPAATAGAIFAGAFPAAPHSLSLFGLTRLE